MSPLSSPSLHSFLLVVLLAIIYTWFPSTRPPMRRSLPVWLPLQANSDWQVNDLYKRESNPFTRGCRYNVMEAFCGPQRVSKLVQRKKDATTDKTTNVEMTMDKSTPEAAI
jgi:hypothetical protein